MVLPNVKVSYQGTILVAGLAAVESSVRDPGMTEGSFKHAVERGLIPGPRIFT